MVRWETISSSDGGDGWFRIRAKAEVCQHAGD